MVGEFTEKIKTYEQIAKANGVELTREVKNTITDLVVMEDQTKKQIEEFEKRSDIIDKIQSQNEFQSYVKEVCGSFYFNFYGDLLDKIEPQYLTRFLYLCTHLDYEGRLVKRVGKRNVVIDESELGFVLRLSRTETHNTKNVLIKNDLIKIERGIIYINSKFCKKGGVIKGCKVERSRMFDDTIKELYESCKKTEHKKLALLFRLLPYVNLRWNVICKNPTEEIFEEIEPYDVKELMTLLNQSNITRFKRSLLDLTVKDELAMCINTNKYGDLLTINPKVYYKGVNLEELKYLIGLFSIKRPIGINS